MSTFYSLGSLVFGLIAWIVPFMAISRYNGKTNSMVFCPLSFSCCAIALVLQIFEIKHRVQIEDWAAIMDTIGPLSWVSVILVVITIFLNVIAINIRKTNN